MATLHKIEDRCGAVELRVRLYQQRDVRGRMAFWEEMAREWSVSKGTTYRPDRLRMRYRRLKKEKACGYVPG